MSIGVMAALVVGQWPTTLVILFFMRVGDYAEHDRAFATGCQTLNRAGSSNDEHRTQGGGSHRLRRQRQGVRR